MARSRVVLLGPQRHEPNLAPTVESLDIHGGIATVTAGWEEREAEDEELVRHLGRPTLNLGLFPRMEDVFRRDPELFEGFRELRSSVRKLGDLYRLRLGHALQAARELFELRGSSDFVDQEISDAIGAVRTIDTQHLARLKTEHAVFEERFNTLERDAIAHHRHELKHLLDDAGLLCIAGGHVAILLNRLRLLGVLDLFQDRPIIGWSAGAMVLTDRIVLFHDSPPQGPGDAEVYDTGLGECPEVVPLPHASKRLRLDDATRVALLSRRFEPAIPCALDAGTRMEWDGSVWTAESGTRRLTESGELAEIGS